MNMDYYEIFFNLKGLTKYLKNTLIVVCPLCLIKIKL